MSAPLEPLPFEDPSSPTEAQTHAQSRSAKKGMLPGTPVYIGNTPPFQPTVHAIIFNRGTCQEKIFDCVEDFEKFDINLEPDPEFGQPILWLNIDGLADTELLMDIGKRFDINALAMEDIANTEQRTKLDDYERYLFIVMKMLEADYNEPNHAEPIPVKDYKQPSPRSHHFSQRFHIDYEQVSFILGKNFLITFLEDPGDVFDSVRYQLRENKGRIRRLGTDYLLYALIDSIVDHYFGIIETFGEHLEHLSDLLLRHPTPTTLRTIHRLRQQTLKLRRTLWPLREVLGHLQRDESELVQQGTKLYFRDVYDHAIEIIDTLETNRDILAGMADMYLSSSSYQLNVVMKLLTVISTIFIPLTFITSVYGMNFKYMPELDSSIAYPAVWAIMITIAIAMLLYFKRQRWLD